MKEKLNAIGTKLANLMNQRLKEDDLNEERYLMTLDSLKTMIEWEIKAHKNEIVDVETELTK
jgi:hypothetical protein